MEQVQIVKVASYDPEWPRQFIQLRDKIRPAASDLAIAIEHVGSTSVPGLSAKPVIDLDIVIPSREDLPEVVRRLASLGYEHRGDLGIPDRDAFRALAGPPPHHLYVCPSGSVALRNHITLRDHLRAHPLDAAAYSALKVRLAERYSSDIDCYVQGKSEFILMILEQYGFSTGQLDLIRNINQVK